MIEAEKASFALVKYLKSKLFSSKRTKVHLYTTIIRPTLTYGCEVWAQNTENHHAQYDNESGCWRRRKKQRDSMRIDRNCGDN